jgi:uncharacterized membrane protein
MPITAHELEVGHRLSGIIFAPGKAMRPRARWRWRRILSMARLEQDDRWRIHGCNDCAPTQETPLLIFRGGETHSRSVFKAISWRALGTLDTFAISWFMTGKIAMAGSIAGLEIVTKVAWYYLHERIWAVVSWGRR